MSQGRLIVACDFGTTMFRALVTEVRSDGDMEIVGCAQHEACGYQDGDFVDIKTAAEGIAGCIRDLEADSNIYVSGFTHNIAGSHLHSVQARAQVSILAGPRPIKPADVEKVLKQARSMAIPFDQKILTVTPVAYSVDRVGGITDPQGRVGSLLEVTAHLVTGSRSVLANIQNTIVEAKYKTLGEEVDVMAAGTALLAEQEMQEGVMLIDIGGEMTNWVVYRHGGILANGCLAWGGKHLTRDLAHGLRMEWDEAEELKRDKGVVLRSLAPEVAVSALFGESKPAACEGLVAAILEPRMEEILTLVKNDFGDMRELATLGAGIVLTGGGSRCEGTAALCEEIFDLQSQERYLPRRLAGADQLPDGQWATAIGLCRWSARDLAKASPMDSPQDGHGLLGKLKGIFKRPNLEDEMVARG